MLTLFYLVSSIYVVTCQRNFFGPKFGCDCMEYWDCVTKGGHPYSYCGLTEATVCCYVPSNAKPIGIVPPDPKEKTCGKKGVDTKREGFAEMSEYPWHTAVLEKQQDLYVCGAALVDEYWVLTAAHCVDDYFSLQTKPLDLLKVRLGEYDVSALSEPLQHSEIDVSRIVLHPDFENTTLANDIALLKLVTKATKRQNINAICMPKHDINATTKTNCYVTGWGKTSETSDHSVILKEIHVPLWKNDRCQGALKKFFGDEYKLPETAICAGSEGKDACDGDGGGPLVCEKDGVWYQVGIVSFGIGCGRKNVPGVYTRVAAYEHWIKEVIHHFKS